MLVVSGDDVFISEIAENGTLKRALRFIHRFSVKISGLYLNFSTKSAVKPVEN